MLFWTLSAFTATNVNDEYNEIYLIYYSPVPSTGSLLLRIKTDACTGTDTEVRYLEHVQAVITANATRRGDLELFVTSPMGTRYNIIYR